MMHTIMPSVEIIINREFSLRVNQLIFSLTQPFNEQLSYSFTKISIRVKASCVLLLSVRLISDMVTAKEKD